MTTPTPTTTGAAASDPAPAAPAPSDVIRHERDARSLFEVRIHPKNVRCELCE